MPTTLEDLTPNELLVHAKKSDAEVALFRTLVNSPDTREATLKLIRQKNPTMPIPELDAKTAIEKQLDDANKKFEALEAKVRDGDIRGRIDKERERVKKKYELSDEDVAEVEKIMMREDAPIPHYDAAAKVFRAEKTLATPTTSALRAPVFSMPEDKEWRRGIGNPAALNKVALEKAYDVLNQLRGAKAA